MSMVSHAARITELRDEYSEGVMYTCDGLSYHTDTSVGSHSFIGSASAVFLSSDDMIRHAGPGCLAAPLVTMVAKSVITLGFNDCTLRSRSLPLRIYTPQQLSITTNWLTVGDLDLLAEPSHGFIVCKKLFLYKPPGEDPPYFEVVKSWVLNDDAEITTCVRTNTVYVG